MPTPFALSGSPPYTRSTFTDGATYTVNDIAAFDGTNYFRMTGSPPQFTAAARTYTLRTDAVSIAAGGAKTYLVKTTGALSPNQFTFGTQTIFLGRPTDLAAFDGQHYYAISNNQFTDTNTGNTFTLSGNTAVHEGNSYEIFSNLGAGRLLRDSGRPGLLRQHSGRRHRLGERRHLHRLPGHRRRIHHPAPLHDHGRGRRRHRRRAHVQRRSDRRTHAHRRWHVRSPAGSSSTRSPRSSYTCVIDGTLVTFVDSNNVVYPFPAPGTTNLLIATWWSPRA